MITLVVAIFISFWKRAQENLCKNSQIYTQHSFEYCLQILKVFVDAQDAKNNFRKTILAAMNASEAWMSLSRKVLVLKNNNCDIMVDKIYYTTLGIATLSHVIING